MSSENKKNTHNLKKLLFSIFLKMSFIFIHNTAFGFFPEYEHYQSSEQLEINSPRLIESEYQSDKLTYLIPIQLLDDWYSSDKVFQYAAGSLGPTRFLTRGRMKLREEIAPKLYFQISYLDRGDFEQVRNSFVFEFAYRILPQLNLAIYGEPATLKKEDNAGLAAEWLFSERNKLRVFYTSVHFSHNKRNELSDYYAKKPSSYGFVWRSFDESSSSINELSFRHDQNLEQVFPDSGRVYQYGNKSLSFLTKQNLSKDFDNLLIDLNASLGFEADNINTDKGVSRWEYKKADLLVQYQNPNWKIDWVGLKFIYNTWRSESGNVIHNDILPHAWLTLIQSSEDSWASDWRAGYELTWHQGHGSQDLRGGLDRDNTTQHRLNLRYDLRISKVTQFFTLLTFDLDKFGSGETWEGGSMQFSTTF